MDPMALRVVRPATTLSAEQLEADALGRVSASYQVAEEFSLTAYVEKLRHEMDLMTRAAKPGSGRRAGTGGMVIDKNHNTCDSCGQPGVLLCCDACPASFHFDCLNPPADMSELAKSADAKWYCNECSAQSMQSRSAKSISELAGVVEADKMLRAKFPDSAFNSRGWPVFDVFNSKEFKLPISIKGVDITQPSAGVSALGDYDDEAVSKRARKRRHEDNHDSWCSICMYGGSLLACSTCFRCFHWYCCSPPLLPASWLRETGPDFPMRVCADDYVFDERTNVATTAKSFLENQCGEQELDAAQDAISRGSSGGTSSRAGRKLTEPKRFREELFSGDEKQRADVVDAAAEFGEDAWRCEFCCKSTSSGDAAMPQIEGHKLVGAFHPNPRNPLVSDDTFQLDFGMRSSVGGSRSADVPRPPERAGDSQGMLQHLVQAFGFYKNVVQRSVGEAGDLHRQFPRVSMMLLEYLQGLQRPCAAVQQPSLPVLDDFVRFLAWQRMLQLTSLEEKRLLRGTVTRARAAAVLRGDDAEPIEAGRAIRREIIEQLHRSKRLSRLAYLSRAGEEKVEEEDEEMREWIGAAARGLRALRNFEDASLNGEDPPKESEDSNSQAYRTSIAALISDEQQDAPPAQDLESTAVTSVLASDTDLAANVRPVLHAIEKFEQTREQIALARGDGADAVLGIPFFSSVSDVPVPGAGEVELDSDVSGNGGRSGRGTGRRGRGRPRGSGRGASAPASRASTPSVLGVAGDAETAATAGPLPGSRPPSPTKASHNLTRPYGDDVWGKPADTVLFRVSEFLDSVLYDACKGRPVEAQGADAAQRSQKAKKVAASGAGRKQNASKEEQEEEEETMSRRRTARAVERPKRRGRQLKSTAADGRVEEHRSSADSAVDGSVVGIVARRRLPGTAGSATAAAVPHEKAAVKKRRPRADSDSDRKRQKEDDAQHPKLYLQLGKPSKPPEGVEGHVDQPESNTASKTVKKRTAVSRARAVTQPAVKKTKPVRCTMPNRQYRAKRPEEADEEASEKRKKSPKPMQSSPSNPYGLEPKLLSHTDDLAGKMGLLRSEKKKQKSRIVARTKAANVDMRRQEEASAKKKNKKKPVGKAAKERLWLSLSRMPDSDLDSDSGDGSESYVLAMANAIEDGTVQDEELFSDCEVYHDVRRLNARLSASGDRLKSTQLDRSLEPWISYRPAVSGRQLGATETMGFDGTVKPTSFGMYGETEFASTRVDFSTSGQAQAAQIQSDLPYAHLQAAKIRVLVDKKSFSIGVGDTVDLDLRVIAEHLKSRGYDRLVVEDSKDIGGGELGTGSGRHACITFDSQSHKFELMNYSPRGTWVGDELYGEKPAILYDGVCIRFVENGAPVFFSLSPEPISNHGGDAPYLPRRS